MADITWKCPHCNHDTVIGEANSSTNIHFYNSKKGNMALVTNVRVCPNPKCDEFSITADLYNANMTSKTEYTIDLMNNLDSWMLHPKSIARVQPDYIPLQIRNDYYEACAIVKLSPKASATLSRRCMQGMIRDRWNVFDNYNRLIEEIRRLQDLIDPLTWAAIDAVRRMGNIGSHMEGDINKIIDIDKNEAEILIRLIEELFHDWYIVRHEREEIKKKIIEKADEKKPKREPKGN